MAARSCAASTLFVVQSDAACINVDIGGHGSQELGWTLPPEIQAQFQRLSLLHLFNRIYTLEKRREFRCRQCAFAGPVVFRQGSGADGCYWIDCDPERSKLQWNIWVGPGIDCELIGGPKGGAQFGGAADASGFH